MSTTMHPVMALAMNQIEDVTLSNLAKLALIDMGKKIPFGALPYPQAMQTLESIDDSYGCDPGKHIVAYFLGNATSWRGEVARRIKAELKRRLA